MNVLFESKSIEKKCEFLIFFLQHFYFLPWLFDFFLWFIKRCTIFFFELFTEIISQCVWWTKTTTIFLYHLYHLCRKCVVGSFISWASVSALYGDTEVVVCKMASKLMCWWRFNTHQIIICLICDFTNQRSKKKTIERKKQNVLIKHF